MIKIWMRVHVIAPRIVFIWVTNTNVCVQLAQSKFRTANN